MVTADSNLLLQWKRRALLAETKVAAISRVVDELYDHGLIFIESRYRLQEVLGASYEEIQSYGKSVR